MWRITTVLFTAIPALTPLSGEAEAQGDKSKAEDHIPSTDIRDRILSGSDVENDDPDEASDECANHDWG